MQCSFVCIVTLLLDVTLLLPGDSVPAPSSYTLPSMIGPNIPTRASSATFVMTGRPKIGGFSDDYKKTPAPNNYSVVEPDVLMTKSPVYSMRSRSYMPGGMASMCMYCVM